MNVVVLRFKSQRILEGKKQQNNAVSRFVSDSQKRPKERNLTLLGNIALFVYCNMIGALDVRRIVFSVHSSIQFIVQSVLWYVY